MDRVIRDVWSTLLPLISTNFERRPNKFELKKKLETRNLRSLDQ